MGQGDVGSRSAYSRRAAFCPLTPVIIALRRGCGLDKNDHYANPFSRKIWAGVWPMKRLRDRVRWG